MKSIPSIRAALVGCFVLSIFSQANATVPFTENFTSSVSNWADSTGQALATFVPSGGPDGSSYASATFNNTGTADGTGVIVFRAQDEFNSSNHAFEGNWIGSGITHFSAYVLSNAPVPVTFFARFATPANFPGVAADNGTIAQPNTWTQLSFDIDPSQINVTLFPEGSPALPLYNQVFSGLGHVQIGYDVPTGYSSSTFTFGLDKVSITPEPTSGVLALGFAAIGFIRRRSRTA